MVTSLLDQIKGRLPLRLVTSINSEIKELSKSNGNFFNLKIEELTNPNGNILNSKCRFKQRKLPTGMVTSYSDQIKGSYRLRLVTSLNSEIKELTKSNGNFFNLKIEELTNPNGNFLNSKCRFKQKEVTNRNGNFFSDEIKGSYH